MIFLKSAYEIGTAILSDKNFPPLKFLGGKKMLLSRRRPCAASDREWREMCGDHFPCTWPTEGFGLAVGVERGAWLLPAIISLRFWLTWQNGSGNR
jgi:hypothetical protein